MEASLTFPLLSLPYDLILAVVGYACADDLQITTALCQVSHNLREWATRSYLIQCGIIDINPKRYFTTIRLLGDIAPVIIKWISSFASLIPKHKRIRLELDLFYLIGFSDDLNSLIAQCPVSSLRIAFHSDDIHLLEDSRTPLAVVSLLAAASKHCQSDRSLSSIHVERHMVGPAKPQISLPSHHNLAQSTSTADACLASMKETMGHIRTLWIDFTFFRNPPLQGLIPILLQGDQMDSIYCECPSKTVADDTLSSLHLPKLSSLSVIIRDACCIKFPDGFARRHPQLRRLSLIHLEHNSDTVQFQGKPFPAHLPSLESVVLSSNYARWSMEDASSLRDFLIIPSNHHPPADSELYCEVMKSPCLLMASSQPLLLPLNSALQIHWPSDVQKHATLRSGLQCICTPNHHPLVQHVASLEITLDCLDPTVFVSLVRPYPPYIIDFSSGIRSWLAGMVS